MFQTPIYWALCSLVNITHKDSEPAFTDCSLRGFSTETSPAIDRFELEEDCPYICELLANVAQMERFQPMPNNGPLTVRITSFSYKKGIPEDLSGNGGGFVFDCRAPLNPGRYIFYRSYTGLDDVVIDFLEGRRDENGGVIPAEKRIQGNTSMQTFVENVYKLVDPAVDTYLKRGFTSLVINCGCTGGQHRSVYCAQHIAEHIHECFPEARIILIHREQQISQKF
jgi:RNase adaptor protein for sRNA GlmZ degradation